MTLCYKKVKILEAKLLARQEVVLTLTELRLPI